MAEKDLYASIAGVTSPISVIIQEGSGQTTANCSIECVSTALSIGDEIIVDLGYTDAHGVVFTGVVKSIGTSAPDGKVTLSCFDKYILAVDFFLAYQDLESGFSRSYIDATDLVEALVNLAGLTNFTGIKSYFTFTEPTFNLVSSADAITQIENIIVWKAWADELGVIHWADRKPYVTGSDTPEFAFVTGNSGTIIADELVKSTKNLRNKVVVYGNEGIYATASAVSPYLPADFYSTAIIASPLITTQSMAQDSAGYNLTLYNRLTQTVNAELIGDYRIHARDIITITEAHTGVSGDWFVQKLTHSFGTGGYTLRLGLTK